MFIDDFNFSFSHFVGGGTCSAEFALESTEGPFYGGSRDSSQCGFATNYEGVKLNGYIYRECDRVAIPETVSSSTPSVAGYEITVYEVSYFANHDNCAGEPIHVTQVAMDVCLASQLGMDHMYNFRAYVMLKFKHHNRDIQVSLHHYSDCSDDGTVFENLQTINCTPWGVHSMSVSSTSLPFAPTNGGYITETYVNMFQLTPPFFNEILIIFDILLYLVYFRKVVTASILHLTRASQ